MRYFIGLAVVLVLITECRASDDRVTIVNSTQIADQPLMYRATLCNQGMPIAAEPAMGAGPLIISSEKGSKTLEQLKKIADKDRYIEITGYLGLREKGIDISPPEGFNFESAQAQCKVRKIPATVTFTVVSITEDPNGVLRKLVVRVEYEKKLKVRADDEEDSPSTEPY